MKELIKALRCQRSEFNPRVAAGDIERCEGCMYLKEKTTRTTQKDGGILSVSEHIKCDLEKIMEEAAVFIERIEAEEDEREDYKED